jgi:hypothetical protein
MQSRISKISVPSSKTSEKDLTNASEIWKEIYPSIVKLLINFFRILTLQLSKMLQPLIMRKDSSLFHPSFSMMKN